MDETETIYTVGELAAAAGVSIRTLQHYDNIGLLPTSGRTAGGRRYYTEEDLFILEQILFYKSLGLSLHEIRGKVVAHPEPSEMTRILQEQELALFRKIEDAHAGLAAIEACRTSIAAGNHPSWQLLTGFIRTLRNSNLTDWRGYPFNEDQNGVFGKQFSNKQDAFDLYHTWRKLALRAVTLAEAGAKPEDPAAQRLAEDWLKMVAEATGGEAEHIDAFAQVQRDRERWPEGDRELMEASQAFIDLAVQYRLAPPKEEQS